MLEKSEKSIKISKGHFSCFVKAYLEGLITTVTQTLANKAISEVDGSPE
ncbi:MULTISPECIES: hypothetical protein [unclassified Prochlorococcus]|nr:MULTISPECIES: hypothetical protein [unclassified Prochlorococcus]KGG18369.1 hypothetical protein EV07_0285 [Prochlorococcus sp. MIT 0603]